MFFSLESSLFISKNSFFINLLGPEELILLLPQYLSENLWDLYNSSHEVSYTRCYEKKKTPKYFIHWKVCVFFSKICDFNNHLGLKKCSGKLYSISRDNFWTLVSCSLRFITLDNKGEKWAKSFVTWKQLFFWNVCFYRPLRSQRNDDIFCTITVKIPCGLLKNVVLRHFDVRY